MVAKLRNQIGLKHKSLRAITLPNDHQFHLVEARLVPGEALRGQAQIIEGREHFYDQHAWDEFWA